VTSRILILLPVLGLVAAACSSTDGAIFDDFEDGHISGSHWEVFSYSSTGAVDEVNGSLKMHGLSGGWDGVGVRFVQEVDLTAGPLVVEFRARSGNSEVLCSMTHRATRGDPYLERPMSEWYIKDGMWEFNSPDDGHEATPKFHIQVDQQAFHDYSITLQPTNNPGLYDYRTTVDGGQGGEQRGKWTPNGGDATSVHLFFHTCQENAGGTNTGSFFEEISIESPSIYGEAGGCQVGL